MSLFYFAKLNDFLFQNIFLYSPKKQKRIFNKKKKK